MSFEYPGNGRQLPDRSQAPLDAGIEKWSFANITKKWQKPPISWKLAAAGQFAIKFGEEFSAVATD